MTVQKFPNTPDGEAKIAAIKEPKNIWINSDEIIVSTGTDYVPPTAADAIRQELAANSALDALAASVAKSRNISKEALVAELEASRG